MNPISVENLAAEMRRSFFGNPKTHLRFASALVDRKNGIKDPRSFKVVICSRKKLKVLLPKYIFYFTVIYRMFLLVPIIRQSIID